ncbi:MAG: hypothetical protein CMP09_02790 [Yangia sp.]|nr:hypothetical protein [Salipiger sp.]
MATDANGHGEMEKDPLEGDHQYLKILTEWKLLVSGDQIDLVSKAVKVPLHELEDLERARAAYDRSDPDPDTALATLLDAVGVFGDYTHGVASADAGFGSGKLHKSLHKSLGMGSGATAYGGGGFSWPEIEVPWRDIARLYDLRDTTNWDRHWLPETKEGNFYAPPEIDQLAEELKVLHLMQDELRRPENAWRRERIVIEATNNITAYMLPLGADAGTPAGQTATMFQVILWLGSMIGQQYKARYNLPRPNVLDPTLEPFIPVPVYSSFPSNHAFQSFLIAEVFSRMVPEHGGAAALFHAAWKVAINREFAGLHYRSDTLAGIDLARRCAPAVEEALKDHRRGVRAEWLGESEEGGA